MGNILGSCGSRTRAEVVAAAKLIFQAADLPEARRRLAEFGERFAKTATKAVACLDAGFEDAMAVMALPEKYRKATTDDQHAGATERGNPPPGVRHLHLPKRRVGIGPIDALLAGQNETWMEQRYLDMQEYHEWAAACAAWEGNNVVALPG
jgi:hypothetical protein